MQASKVILCGTLLSALIGCGSMDIGGMDLGNAIGAGSDLYNAASLDDKQVQEMALSLAKESDSTNKVAAPSGAHAKRLAKLTANLKNWDGLKLDFKAYESPEVNAFALANGSLRFYSGLMDMATDDELLSVIGHEIGHVKAGHSKEKMRLAYMASAARKGAASQNNIAGAVAASELGGLLEAIINAQFSQAEEEESDDYGVALLKKLGRDPKASPSMLRKLAATSGGGGGLLASHPDPLDRAERVEEGL